MKTEQGTWLSSMARQLVCEITQQMTGIVLFDLEIPPSVPRKMAVVRGVIGGDYALQVDFFADYPLFVRLTENMMGEPPSADDVEDYAIEFFNTLCGRFLSEIINETHISARLMPLRYELPGEEVTPEADESMCTLNFVSDAQEQVAFSWTAISMEDLTRRSKVQ